MNLSPSDATGGVADYLEFTKKKLLVEVVRLEALFDSANRRIIHLESELETEHIKVEALEARNSEVLNRLLDRELGLAQAGSNEDKERKITKPLGRRPDWRQTAANYTRQDREAVNAHWKNRIKQVETADGMNAVASDVAK